MANIKKLGKSENDMKAILEHIEENKSKYGIKISNKVERDMNVSGDLLSSLGCSPDTLYIYLKYRDQINECKDTKQLDQCIKTEVGKENKQRNAKTRNITLKTIAKVLGTVALTVVSPPLGIAAATVTSITSFRDVRKYRQERNEAYTEDIQGMKFLLNNGRKMKRQLKSIAKFKDQQKDLQESMEHRIPNKIGLTLEKGSVKNIDRILNEANNRVKGSLSNSKIQISDQNINMNSSKNNMAKNRSRDNIKQQGKDM